MLDVRKVLAALDAVRNDRLVGRGSCSSIDECMEDEEVIGEIVDMMSAGEVSSHDVVAAFREKELTFLDMGTACSSGEPDCPLVAAYREFKAEMRKP